MIEFQGLGETDSTEMRGSGMSPEMSEIIHRDRTTKRYCPGKRIATAKQKKEEKKEEEHFVHTCRR